MAALIGQAARNFVCLLVLVVAAACSKPQASGAAPFAGIVQDSRTGEVYYSNNADTRLHPASLTKMMTLYITFEEIQRGRLSLDTMVTITKNAAAKPPSRLGLRAGQKVAVRYLIRAAAIKSANDAASALGDHIGGSEAKFAARMNATAKALGMSSSTFKNANGLTAAGHLSTARDMNTLGRRLFYDYPQYYNIFSRRTADAGTAQVRNTNSRFLDAYEGADGIKTGYTNAAGFNLTASAERGNVRIMTTVFGGTSTAQRNAKVTELLNIGFKKAPRNAPTNLPARPQYDAAAEALLLSDATDSLPEVSDGAAKTIRLQLAVASSPRPQPRPNRQQVAAASEAVAAIEGSIAAALAEATTPPPPPGTLDAQVLALVETATQAPPQAPNAASAEASAEVPAEAPVQLAAAIPAPPPRPESLLAAAAPAETSAVEVAAAPEVVAEPELVLAEAMPAVAIAPPMAGTLDAQAMALAHAGTLDAQAEALQVENPVQVAALNLPSAPAPPTRRAPIYDSAPASRQLAQVDEPVVIRLSTSNARHWGVTLGKFNSRSVAERTLLKTQLAESTSLNEGLRKVIQRGGGYEANFMGLTQEQADLACRRLQARSVECFTMGP